MANSFTPSSSSTAPIASSAQAKYTGIIGTEVPALPAGAATDIADPFADNYARALIDAVCVGLGYQAQSDAAASVVSVSPAPYADAGGYPSWTFTAPMSKTYVLRVDLSAYMLAAIDSALFRITVDGAAPSGQPTNMASQYFATLGLAGRQRLSWTVAVPLVAGARVIKIQWGTLGAGFISTDATDSRCFTIVGG